MTFIADGARLLRKTDVNRTHIYTHTGNCNILHNARVFPPRSFPSAVLMTLERVRFLTSVETRENALLFPARKPRRIDQSSSMRG